jgi:integrase
MRYVQSSVCGATLCYASGIFRFARFSHGLRDNPAEGISEALLPDPPKRNQPSLSPAAVAGFDAELDRPHEDDELARIALELVMHTVLRSTELRGGRWSEIRGKEWHVPGARMKVRRAGLERLEGPYGFIAQAIR